MWYRFVARGRETLYGWTTNPDVAQAALDSLREEDRRAGREFDFYVAQCLGESGIDEETAELCARMEREQWQTHLIDDDTTLEDIERWEEALIEERRLNREAAKREAHLQWGWGVWRMWLARMVDGCSPAALAAALEFASQKGYCQPGDPTETVPADAKDASLQVRARSLYRHLLTLHPDDREEGLAIARAIVATPASWQRLESRDPTVRDCIHAARAEAVPA